MSFTTTIDLGDLGEREAEVEFDYLPYEPPHYYGNNPCPSSDEETTITSVVVEIVKGQPVDVLALLTDNAISTLEEEAAELGRMRCDRRRHSARFAEAF